MKTSRFQRLERSMGQNKLQKLFGIGPMGAAISLLLLALASWADRMIDRSVLVVYAAPMKVLGIVLVILGLGFISGRFGHCGIGGQMVNSAQWVPLSISVTPCMPPGLRLYLRG